MSNAFLLFLALPQSYFATINCPSPLGICR